MPSLSSFPLLLTHADSQAFWDAETALVREIDALGPAERPVAQARMTVLHEQAAWLEIEALFDAHPTLEALEVSVDEEDGYPWVATQHEDDEDFGDPGDDPAGIAQDLQETLNNLGRRSFAAFYRRLSQASLWRDTLKDAARQVLGGAWVAARERQNLEEALPTPPAASRGPRM